MLIFLMQEISNSSGFLGTLFHTFFMLFMRVEKINEFWISCTSHRSGDMYRNFMLADPAFQLRRCPRQRAQSRWNFVSFSFVSTLLYSYFSRKMHPI
jgi:hypothetical protein